MLTQKSRHGHAVDRILPGARTVAVAAYLVIAADDAHAVPDALQMLNQLGATQLISPLVVRRIEIADDQDSQVLLLADRDQKISLPHASRPTVPGQL